MGNTITIRVPKPLSTWLQEKSARTGMSQGQIVREQLERVRRGDKKTKNFMRLAGIIKNGPRDLSTRKGFSKR
jgi:predicted DNA-binding protein